MSNRSSKGREDDSWSIFDLFRRMDGFAKPVAVNYRGREAFSSVGGGCLSLLIALVIIAFTAVRVEQLVTRRAPRIVQGLEQ